MTALKSKYDFMMIYDVINGNANGDPDADGAQRIDPETGNGIATDVCIKHKIRNYVSLKMKDADKYRIYIRDDNTLNAKDLVAGYNLNIGDEMKNAQTAGDKGKAKKELETVRKRMEEKGVDLNKEIRRIMCSEFYDIRTFGAVMTTYPKIGLNCGHVKGPVQITFSESVDPVMPTELAITRCAVTTEKDAEDKSNTMGNKNIIPYGLFTCCGHISALEAEKTGFSEEDLELLWEAILNMFEHDRAAMRGEMALRKLIIFEHESELGNAPAHKLFEAVHIARKEGVDVPRKYSDYDIKIDEMPEHVKVKVMG